MSFRVKPMVQGLALAFGGLAVVGTTAYAQQTPPSQQQTLERITITGSNIRRTDQETVAPVEIITREQIERTGQATVAELLRNIPANLGGSFNESFSNSFAPGASGISLRGLGQKTTLVLINGRRTAGYGFAQNIQESFVDINSIPTSAVERIEILKDGASAVYGSDAIAGVVNIILRRDYRGIEVSGGLGHYEGETDYRANIVAGFGDLGSQRFNVFGVLDYYKRDELLFSDTKFGETRDFRGEEGGRNFQNIQAGGTWINGSNRRAISECAQHGGFVLGFDEAVSRGLINLGLNAATGQPNPPPALGTGLNQPGNTWCGTDINKVLSSLPGTERIGFLGRGLFDFTATTQGFAEFAYSRVETDQTFTPPFFAGTTGLEPTAAGLRPFTYNIIFGPGVAGNPFGTNSTFTGNLFSLGTRDLHIESDTYRVLAGIRFAGFGWDAESAIGYSKNEINQENIRRISKSGTSAAFNVPSTPQPPTPISTSSQYNLDSPSTNSAAVNNLLLINFPRIAESELKFIDVKATREIGTLAGGPIGVAVGAEFRKESLVDTPDPNATSGNILGQGITATDADRDNFAMYGEMALPLTRQLEANLALRYDHYSDFGKSINPKIGLKFKPTPEFLLRANWGRGFRAPTLPEISPSVATFFIQVNDPFTGQAGVQVSGIFAGNPNLLPERSTSTTVGMVWEPNSSFNAGVNIYDIHWSNIVGSDSFQDIVDANDPARVIRDPVTGNIVTVLNNFRNLTRTETRGIDMDARYIVRTTWGRFTPRINAVYVIKFEEEGTDFVGSNGGFNTYPRWKAQASLDWDQGPWALRAAANYIHHYRQDLLAGSFFTPQDPRFQTGTYPAKIPSLTTYDFFARYNITANLYVTGAVLNFTDEVPPYDPGFSTTTLYDFSQYDPRGRQYRVNVNYKFK